MLMKIWPVTVQASYAQSQRLMGTMTLQSTIKSWTLSEINKSTVTFPMTYVPFSFAW